MSDVTYTKAVERFGHQVVIKLIHNTFASSRRWHTEAPMMKFGPPRACSVVRHAPNEVPFVGIHNRCRDR
jgi:hypothetical protein